MDYLTTEPRMYGRSKGVVVRVVCPPVYSLDAWHTLMDFLEQTVGQGGCRMSGRMDVWEGWCTAKRWKAVEVSVLAYLDD